MNSEHEKYMRIALQEAQKALDKDEVPIGAIVVCAGKIIGRGHNQTEMLNDVTAHAEMLAITAAENYLGAKYLKDCTLYVSLEPCVMCAGALAWSQISNVVYGASDSKTRLFKTWKRNSSSKNKYYWWNISRRVRRYYNCFFCEEKEELKLRIF